MSKAEETIVDKLTTEMMEHICDNICKYPCRTDIDQEELEDICAECQMARYVCGICNQYNRLNNFEKSQCYSLLQKIAELEQKLKSERSNT